MFLLYENHWLDYQPWLASAQVAGLWRGDGRERRTLFSRINVLFEIPEQMLKQCSYRDGGGLRPQGATAEGDQLPPVSARQRQLFVSPSSLGTNYSGQRVYWLDLGFY